jgi:hypothetical protein
VKARANGNSLDLRLPILDLRLIVSVQNYLPQKAQKTQKKILIFRVFRAFSRQIIFVSK